MLRSKVAFILRKKHRKHGPSKLTNPNTAKLRLAKEGIDSKRRRTEPSPI